MPASTSRVAAPMKQKNPHETIACDSKFPISVSPITSGVNGFSRMGAVGLSAVAEGVEPALQIREDHERRQQQCRQRPRASASGASGDSRQSTTSTAIPIGNIDVSNAGASTGGMPM